MSKLYSRRRARQLKMLLKYFRLVFNDHFIIALFFLFGALAYGYAQLLSQLSANLWWSRPLLVIWFVLVAQLGRFATLLERPDSVFLLPQSAAMKAYLNRAYRYSLGLAELMTIAGTAVALPFAMTTERVTTPNIIGIVLTALLVKENCLGLVWGQISLSDIDRRRWIQWAKWLEPLLAWLLGWLIVPWLGLAAALIIELFNHWLVKDFAINWRAAIKLEQGRMNGVYRFFNLFTDVPSVQGNVKRRRWANGLMNHLTISGHPWSYLYTRGAVRNAEISGLIVRLTIIAMLIVFFIPAGWLNTVVCLLFIYLIATQMMPFSQQYDDNVMTHLFQSTVEEQLADFQHLMTRGLLVATILMAAASLGRSLNWQQALVNLVLSLILLFLLTRFYFKSRLRRMGR